MTKKMLKKLRENRYRKAEEKAKDFIVEETEKDNFLTRSRILMEEAVMGDKKKVITEGDDSSHENSFVISKNTPQFGDVRTSQEETIRKTISDNIILSDEALKYYPDADDITLTGRIPSLNVRFQFRYNDPSGQGAYLWAEALQMTEENTKTIAKLRSAFQNWKDSITQDGDLMMRLKKASSQD